MKNIEITRQGAKLTITIDLSQKGEPSSSGKTTVLASTNGNVDVIGCEGVKMGINVFAYDGYRTNVDSFVGSFKSSREYHRGRKGR